jgi:hypothetical protein
MQPTALGIDGAYFFAQGANLLTDGADVAGALLELLADAGDVLLGAVVAVTGEVNVGGGLGVLQVWGALYCAVRIFYLN